MAKMPVGNFLPDLRARATGPRSGSKCSDTEPSRPESPGMVAGLRCVQELSAARGLFLELLPSWVLASATHIGVVMDQRAVVSGVKEDAAFTHLLGVGRAVCQLLSWDFGP